MIKNDKILHFLSGLGIAFITSFIFKHSPTCLGLNNTFPSNSNTSTSLFSKVHDINIQNYNLTIV